MNRLALMCALVAVLAAAASPALGRTVDLSTVPARQSVQLTIYNSEDLTLVRDIRKVTFKKGANPLQFSWANTLIDPSSVELKFLTSPDKLTLLDTTFPHDKPQMLYWNVNSEIDGEATIEITYFTSGITWNADYEVIADKDEKALHFDGFVRVTNRSGEEYEDAQVRLVVGTINLVEKIAQLAQIPMKEVAGLEKDHYARLRLEGAKGPMSAAAAGVMSSDMPHREIAAEKQIIKEGLSEYFIFSIPGTESIPNGWSKRMRSVEAAAVPFKIQYRYRPAEYGDQLVRMYLLTNDKDSKLGTSPLPDGVVKLFRDNGRDGLSYLTQQSIKYIPIGDKIELNLGVDPEVIFELIKLRAFRDNIWMHLNTADLYQRIGGGIEIEVNSSVVGWDEHEIYTQRVRNYTAKPIDLEIRRTFPGHVIFRGNLPGQKNHDYQTVQFTSTVDAGKRADLLFEIVRHQGYNSKQTNVTIEQVDVKGP